MPGWWVAEFWQQNQVLLISWVFWVIFSITLHELAHGWVAIYCGDRTPIETGHMTWNPLVHMGSLSLIMFAITGITWGQMPVNPARFRGRYDDAKVSFAGPAMNLLLSVFCILAYGVWIGAAGGYWSMGVVEKVLFENTQTFFRVGAMINLFGVLFNLLPVPPLDGSRILASVSSVYRRFLEGEQAQLLSLMALVGLFYFGGEVVFKAAFAVTEVATNAVVRVSAPGAAK